MLCQAADMISIRLMSVEAVRSATAGNLRPCAFSAEACSKTRARSPQVTKSDSPGLAAVEAIGRNQVRSLQWLQIDGLEIATHVEAVGPTTVLP